jgi:hypothetical protein
LLVDHVDRRVALALDHGLPPALVFRLEDTTGRALPASRKLLTSTVRKL